MPTKLPEGFEVSDQVKLWSLRKFGFECLPGFFINRFREHFAAKGTRYDDWDKCLKNYINRNAPNGEFYNPARWEEILDKCKATLYKSKPKVEVPDMEYKRDRKVGEQALSKLAAIKQRILDEYEQKEQERLENWATDTMPEEEEKRQREAYLNGQ